jgi:sugar lactone lactonase YvrE
MSIHRNRYAGEILLVWGFLMLATPLVYGQSSTSNATQTVIADSNSNGLNLPGGVAAARDGKIFIVDTGNNRVVEEPWSSSTKAYGAQTVLIANPYNPDGVAVSTSGNVFVADTGNNRVVEIPWTRASGVYGPATEIGSGLNSPHGVAVAANGDLYIADMGNNRVVEVLWDRSKDTYGAQTTVGTNLLSPEAVAVGSGGMVYIANNRVIKMTQSVRNHAAGNNGGLHMRR